MTGLREALEGLAADLNQKAVAAKTNEADSAYCDAVTMVNALWKRLNAEPAPVASRERVAEVLRRTVLATTYGGQIRLADVDPAPLLDALLAAGVFRDEATVKAEALAETLSTARDFRGVYEAAAAAEVAEKIAEAAEEAADELDLPVMAEWLDQRVWFKGQLHALAAKAREIGGAS